MLSGLLLSGCGLIKTTTKSKVNTEHIIEQSDSTYVNKYDSTQVIAVDSVKVVQVTQTEREKEHIDFQSKADSIRIEVKENIDSVGNIQTIKNITIYRPVKTQTIDKEKEKNIVTVDSTEVNKLDSINISGIDSTVVITNSDEFKETSDIKTIVKEKSWTIKWYVYVIIIVVIIGFILLSRSKLWKIIKAIF